MGAAASGRRCCGGSSGPPPGPTHGAPTPRSRTISRAAAPEKAPPPVAKTAAAKPKPAPNSARGVATSKSTSTRALQRQNSKLGVPPKSTPNLDAKKPTGIKPKQDHSARPVSTAALVEVGKVQFGVDPGSCETEKIDGYEFPIPKVLVTLKDYLIKQGGLKKADIFRSSNPGARAVEEVQGQLNAGTFKGTKDMHVLAAVVMSWFRSLPTPILDDPFMQKKIPEVISEEVAEETVTSDEYKEPARSLLLWVLDLCVEVLKHSKDNKMTPQSLASVWSSNLYLQPPNTGGGKAKRAGSGEQALKYGKDVNKFIRFGIVWRAKHQGLEVGEDGTVKAQEDDGDTKIKPSQKEKKKAKDEDKSKSKTKDKEKEKEKEKDAKKDKDSKKEKEKEKEEAKEAETEKDEEEEKEKVETEEAEPNNEENAEDKPPASDANLDDKPPASQLSLGGDELNKEAEEEPKDKEEKPEEDKPAGGAEKDKTLERQGSWWSRKKNKDGDKGKEKEKGADKEEEKDDKPKDEKEKEKDSKKSDKEKQKEEERKAKAEKEAAKQKEKEEKEAAKKKEKEDKEAAKQKEKEEKEKKKEQEKAEKAAKEAAKKAEKDAKKGGDKDKKKDDEDKAKEDEKDGKEEADKDAAGDKDGEKKEADKKELKKKGSWFSKPKSSAL